MGYGFLTPLQNLRIPFVSRLTKGILSFLMCSFNFQQSEAFFLDSVMLSVRLKQAQPAPVGRRANRIDNAGQDGNRNSHLRKIRQRQTLRSIDHNIRRSAVKHQQRIAADNHPRRQGKHGWRQTVRSGQIPKHRHRQDNT